MVFLMGLTGLNLNWSKTYDSKCKYFHFCFLSDFVKKTHLYYLCVFSEMLVCLNTRLLLLPLFVRPFCLLFV